MLEEVEDLELTETLDLLELAKLERDNTLDLLLEDAIRLELARLELTASLDLLLEETAGFEVELEPASELDLLETTLTLDAAFNEDDGVKTGLVATDEVDAVELIPLELKLTFELELNWFSLEESIKLLAADASLKV